VHYYGYGALGTDRYPPFTLADVPDYPAHLGIPYPGRVPGPGTGEVVAAGPTALPRTDRCGRALFTAHYPKPLYTLVMGMDRWSLQVAAYAGLMTDAYRPSVSTRAAPTPAPFPPAQSGRPARACGVIRQMIKWDPEQGAVPSEELLAAMGSYKRRA
jgi:hypothetical protein